MIASVTLECWLESVTTRRLHGSDIGLDFPGRTPKAMVDDAPLLARWADLGDVEAFGELARRHTGLIYGTCRRIVRDHHTAEDVTQECLIELARKAGSVRTSLAGFLHTLATSRARDRLRQDRARQQRELLASSDPPTTAAEPTWAELAPLVDQALADLPEEERLPLVLHFLQGLPRAEVAAQLGCDRTTISRRLTRGIASLRERLGRTGIRTTAVLLSGLLAANAMESAPPACLAAATKMALAGIGTTAPMPIAATVAPALIGIKTVAVLVTVAATICALAGAAWHLAPVRPPPSPTVTPVVPLPSSSPAPTVVRAGFSAPDYYARWANGVSPDPAYFPIGVWYQDPLHARAYHQAGINLFLGLWHGPSEADLTALAAAGMQTICDPTAAALRRRDQRTIVGWMKVDDIHPDGCGDTFPPVDPAVVVQRYDAFTTKDPTRPVYLFFGQGTAWDGYPGRGMRTGHPEDYAGYVRGADILGLEIYPVNDPDPVVSGNLWYLPRGIDRLRSWSGDAKPVWCWIECTRLTTASPAKPTPAQMRAQVWMALIHGANGIGYFCHSWQSGTADEAALLHDPEMLAAVTAVNREVAALARVLNSPSLTGAPVTSSNAGIPIDALVKRRAGTTYVFAAAMRDGTTTATFTAPAGATMVEVLGENRTLPTVGGSFSDRFAAYAVHLYAIADAAELLGRP